MVIFPAIDILGTKAVRLLKGDYNQVTVYSDRPWEFAEDFAKKGCKAIHLVDLDGAHLRFEEIDRELQPVRDELKMTIHMQRMDIFDAMHRI